MNKNIEDALILISDNEDQITELQKAIHNLQRNCQNIRINLLNANGEYEVKKL